MPKAFDTYRDMNSPSEESTVTKPKDSDQDTFKMCMRLYAKAKAVRSLVDGDWDECMDFYKGKQWKGKRPSYRASPTVNIIRPTVQTILPIITDREPSIDVSPLDPSDYAFSETINELVGVWWNRGNMNMVLSDIVFDTLIYPYGVAKICWDQDLYNGLGEVHMKRVDPKSIWVSDGALDFNKENGYVIEEVYMPLGEAKMKFPKHAEKFSSSSDTGDKDSTGKTLSGSVTVVSPIDKDVGLEDSATSGAGGCRSVRLLECWLDDDTTVEYDYEDDAGKKQTGSKKLYPRGRLITIAPGNKLVLQDVPNPYADGLKPYVRFIDSTIAGSFYGEGEVAPLMESQRLLNKATATIVDWMNACTNNVWILDDDSGVMPKDITNQVGLILRKKRGSQVSREPAPPMPDQIFKFYSIMMDLVDQQSGVHDVTQGRKPTGVTAAEAISEMQDAAQTRIRLKERNLNGSLTQAGYMVVSRMLQYYTEPRVVKISGTDSKWPKFYEIFVDQSEDGDGYNLNKKEFQYVESQREYVAVGDWETMGPSEGMFDIEVHAGTALPYMKQKRSSEAFKLFDAGVIDEQALLETVDFPDWEQILRRQEEKAVALPDKGPPPGGMPV